MDNLEKDKKEGVDDAIRAGKKVVMVSKEAEEWHLNKIGKALGVSGYDQGDADEELCEPPKPRSGPVSATSARPAVKLRPKILLEGNLFDVAQDAGRVFAKYNDPPRYFQQGGIICKIDVTGAGDEETVEAKPVGKALFKVLVADAMDFVEEKITRKGEIFSAPSHPPDDIVKALFEDPQMTGIPALHGVSRFPLLTRNGDLQEEPGYEPSTKSYYLPKAGCLMGAVPAVPTAADVKKSLELLIKELLGDFRFPEDGKDCASNPVSASLCHAVALIMEPIMRSQMPPMSNSPLHLAQASMKNAGKSKLVRAAILAGTGMDPDELTPAGVDKDEEWAKQIARCLRSAPPAISIDNVRGGQLNSAILDRALTSPFFSIRAMHSLNSMLLANNKTWAASANNIELHEDTSRRLVYITLLHNDDDKVFRNGEIVDWTRKNLAELAWATRVIARGWICAGRPQWRSQRPKDSAMADGAPLRFDSFEGWANTMGGLMDWLGLPGFLTNYKKEASRADKEGDEADEFFAVLLDTFKEKPFRASDAARHLEYTDASGFKSYRLCHSVRVEAGADLGSRSVATSMGAWLRRHEGQCRAGMTLSEVPGNRRSYTVTSKLALKKPEEATIDPIG